VIGIISKDNEAAAVQEFFQLFKTPWEPYLPNRVYDLVITTTGKFPADSNLCPLVIYDSESVEIDRKVGVAIHSKHQCQCLEFEDTELPIYGDISTFKPTGRAFLRHRGELGIVGVEIGDTGRPIVRIGYDLFQEVGFLLSSGQPSENAHIPTLDLHVSVLRNVMISAGISFVEIPPAPAGYDFTACLTHDVDFTGIREHKFDSTMWGFLSRALVGSLLGALKGRLSWSKCWRNWQAAFSLPLVFLGLKDDFWLEFDRYLELEKGLGSTFFFIPFKNYPGTRGSRKAPKRRAAKYDLLKTAKQVQDLVENGCEVGLHGIDAWQDSAKALLERSRVFEIAGQPEIGIRMHWLYFDGDSPKVLEEAGFSYDSTFGYNDTVGFRGGTTQVFCIGPARSLLELPLNVQDTALFYPDRMNLSERQAMEACRRLIRQMAHFGGALTINWHTRSLSPERLWGDFYERLLEEIQKYRVWFGTAQQVVSWFQARRELRFEQVQFTENGLSLKIAGRGSDNQLPFVVRMHHPRSRAALGATSRPVPIRSDIHWKGEAELTVAESELSSIS
jgi:hypothetical protein